MLEAIKKRWRFGSLSAVFFLRGHADIGNLVGSALRKRNEVIKLVIFQSQRLVTCFRVAIVFLVKPAESLTLYGCGDMARTPVPFRAKDDHEQNKSHEPCDLIVSHGAASFRWVLPIMQVV